MFFFFKTEFSFLGMVPNAASRETFWAKRFETDALANRLISVRVNFAESSGVLAKIV